MTDRKITTEDVENWELESLSDAIGNCLELNDDFLSRYCGKEVAELLRQVPEPDRESILAPHIGEGRIVGGFYSIGESSIVLPIGEIETQFDGAPEDYFDNPADFVIHGNLAYLSADGAEFPIDVPGLTEDVETYLSDKVRDDIRGEFIRGCLECAIFTGLDDDGNPLEDSYSAEDIPADIRRELESDCDDFLTRNAHYLTDDPFRGGMDFHLTRNRHGAGFWDGDWPKDIGQILTDRAHTYGTSEIQVFTDSNGAAAWCAIH